MTKHEEEHQLAIANAPTRPFQEQEESMLMAGEQPRYRRTQRPSQVYLGILAVPEHGRMRLYDLYCYADGQVIGLRYGDPARDERTHDLEHWRQHEDPAARAVVLHLDEILKWA